MSLAHLGLLRQRASLDRTSIRPSPHIAQVTTDNPLVQYLWANLKGAELANFADDTIAEVANQAQHGIQRVCASESPVVGFLAHTGLSPDDEPSP